MNMVNRVSHGNNVSFGLRNPKAAMYRAEKLKDMYSKNGIKYLLPKDVWSDSKISDKLMGVDRIIKYYLQDQRLTPEILQGAINDILPEASKNKILVKDVSKIKETLINLGYSDETVKAFEGVGGLTIPATGKDGVTQIFVNFKNVQKGSSKEKLDFNTITLHELQHALKDRFQNISASDDFKLDKMPESKRYNVDLFHKFESKFYDYINYNSKTDLSDKDLLKALKVKSRDELYKKFSNVLDDVEKEEAKNHTEFLENKFAGKYSTKDFYENMKNRANDEKYSYEIETKAKRKDQIILRDLFSKLYSEMSRFFAEKKNAAKA